MEKLVVAGGIPLQGTLTLAGAKNVALKTCVCALLTDELITISNLPLIEDVFLMKKLLEGIGVGAKLQNHSIQLDFKGLKSTQVPLEVGARMRTSSLILGPMLARFGEAQIPNPGGCRIGARPINRHIEGLKMMGAEINYNSDDGFFHAKTKRLHGAQITFEKNTHTGTEALILAAVLADGVTTLENAAEEIEINDLIRLLKAMGADISRPKKRQIVIRGVKKLHGASYEIMSDRNEEVTIAIAAAVTRGKITIQRSDRAGLETFLNVFRSSGGQVREIDDTTTEYSAGEVIRPTDIFTGQYPGFMTDWQAPWAIYMTQATGTSTIHETVFENRFTYVSELIKMGAKIDYYQPDVNDPQSYYNFNWTDKKEDSFQGIKIHGRAELHNAVLDMNDLRSGASLLLAALVATGESYIYGVEQIDRGYESIDRRLSELGARITRVNEVKS